MEFAISQPKMFRLPRNEKQTHRLNFRPQLWPSGLTLAMTLTLNFQGQIWNLLYLIQKWSDCHETKTKHIDLNSGPQMWPMGLALAMTLIFEYSRSFVTNWRPRSGVRIYQIVTGVTSVVGVPSTHLVYSYRHLTNSPQGFDFVVGAISDICNIEKILICIPCAPTHVFYNIWIINKLENMKMHRNTICILVS